MSYQYIRYELVDDHVVALTLSRPQRLNALNGPMLDELREALNRIEADDEVRVFLLSGAARADGGPCRLDGAAQAVAPAQHARSVASDSRRRGSALTYWAPEDPTNELRLVDAYRK